MSVIYPIRDIYPEYIQAWKVKRKWAAQACLILRTPRTVAHQAPLSMEFSRQEYWSGLPFPSPGDLPSPWIKVSCIAGRFFTVWATRDISILRHFAGSAPNYSNKANRTIKRFTWIFWFPNAYTSFLYTVL